MLADYYRNMNQQTWLSLDGICNVLQTTRQHISWLVKNNYLEILPSGNGFKHARFLDPTPAYADRLRLAELIYQRRVALPADMDISGKAIFTRAEIAAILGWSENYAQQYLKEHDVESVKLGKVKHGGLRLYTVRAVRDMLWRRSGRKQAASAQKSPFLLQELVAWFLKHQEAAAEGIPTDAEFEDDAVFQKKLAAILKLPMHQRQEAMRDLWGKVEMAKASALSIAQPR